MCRDRREVGRRVGVRPEGIDPPHIRRDSRIARRKQRKRSANAEAGHPDPFRVHLRPLGEGLKGLHDAIDLARLEAPFQQHLRVGHQHGSAGSGQGLGHARHDRVVAADVVHAEHEQDGPGTTLRRRP